MHIWTKKATSRAIEYRLKSVTGGADHRYISVHIPVHVLSTSLMVGSILLGCRRAPAVNRTTGYGRYVSA